jgi:hypothetical protein
LGREHRGSGMSFWSSHHLDRGDSINASIWKDSTDIQSGLQRPSHGTVGQVGALQAMVGPRALPWVPDLAGLRWRSEDALYVVGSAYSPFILPWAGRSKAMSHSAYESSANAQEFHDRFIPSVVEGDSSYYGPLRSLVESLDIRDVSRLCTMDLCRASFCVLAQPDVAKGGDGILRLNVPLYSGLVDAGSHWTWSRLVEGRASRIIALGSVAEIGLLRLFEQRGIRLSVRGRPRIVPRTQGMNWPLKYASSLRLRDWLDMTDLWWEADGVVDGVARRWRILPVYHPAAASYYDTRYARTRVALRTALCFD